ncbi:hypothetical protein LBW62_19760, partial [Ralstonia solanacearum]|uniref:hypothetical protein n=1 Tax=Ralstonia solanacearum TaxID=305 RepID=UPI00230504CE
MPSAGALFGGAVLLLGHAIRRNHERIRAASERVERVAKMRALMKAEQVDLRATHRRSALVRARSLRNAHHPDRLHP